jgi:hypothetical protein
MSQSDDKDERDIPSEIDDDDDLTFYRLHVHSEFQSSTTTETKDVLLQSLREHSHIRMASRTHWQARYELEYQKDTIPIDLVGDYVQHIIGIQLMIADYAIHCTFRHLTRIGSFDGMVRTTKEILRCRQNQTNWPVTLIQDQTRSKWIAWRAHPRRKVQKQQQKPIYDPVEFPFCEHPSFMIGGKPTECVSDFEFEDIYGDLYPGSLPNETIDFMGLIRDCRMTQTVVVNGDNKRFENQVYQEPSVVCKEPLCGYPTFGQVYDFIDEWIQKGYFVYATSDKSRRMNDRLFYSTLLLKMMKTPPPDPRRRHSSVIRGKSRKRK